MKFFKNKTPKQSDQRETSVNSLRAERYRYHSSRQDVETFNRSRNETKKSGFLKNLPVYIFVIAIIFSVGYMLWLDSSPRIRLPEGHSASLLQQEEVYQQEVQSILRHSLSNTNKLTFNSDKIAQQIKDRFPEIDDAVVTIPVASHKPIIDLLPKQPSFIINSQNGAYVIDKSGKVLVRVGDIAVPEGLSLQTVIDQSGIEIKPGMQVVTSDTVDFIRALQFQFSQSKTTIKSMILPGTPNELHVTLQGSDYFVKFDISRDARLQAGTLFALADQLSSQGINPSNYIDVRVPDKAFYK